MKAINEMEIMNNDERIDSAAEKGMFVVEVSKLSMHDEFMQHVPRNAKERMLHEMLETVIRHGTNALPYPCAGSLLTGEYVAFFGTLMKKLVEEGRSVEEAWNMVCGDDHLLAKYHDMPEKVMSTSTKKSWWAEAANTGKLLKESGDTEKSVSWIVLEDDSDVSE